MSPSYYKYMVQSAVKVWGLVNTNIAGNGLNLI